MPERLAPKLKQIAVKYDHLVLDPNNPRFITRQEDKIGEEDFLGQDTSGKTADKMSKERYKITELANSIKQNGWLPVDYIFVRKLQDQKDLYVVLEGNRRVTAIREIMNDEKLDDPKLKTRLKSIEVMEVLDAGSPAELQKRISYLLGVRHHGSLKKWTPFAQAHNIMNRYLERSSQSQETFEWDKAFGKKVADTLSIPIEEVEKRLKVYRLMNQVGNWPEVKKSKGGMKDRYYSVCAEPVLSPRKKLAGYIEQDPKTFLLKEEAVGRINNLCHFHEPDRKGAPVGNPQEWRHLDKILADDDQNKRRDMLRKVEEEKRPPSEVWAVRAKELAHYNWERWLLEVNSILKTVTLDELTDTTSAVPTVKKLLALIADLDARDIYKGAVDVKGN
jgi:hypothetical protein